MTSIVFPGLIWRRPRFVGGGVTVMLRCFRNTSTTSSMVAPRSFILSSAWFVNSTCLGSDVSGLLASGPNASKNPYLNGVRNGVWRRPVRPEAAGLVTND